MQKGYDRKITEIATDFGKSSIVNPPPLLHRLCRKCAYILIVVMWGSPELKVESYGIPCGNLFK
jgi:hypothetical protein